MSWPNCCSSQRTDRQSLTTYQCQCIAEDVRPQFCVLCVMHPHHIYLSLYYDVVVVVFFAHCCPLTVVWSLSWNSLNVALLQGGQIKLRNAPAEQFAVMWPWTVWAAESLVPHHRLAKGINCLWFAHVDLQSEWFDGGWRSDTETTLS